jgi:uncharacterized membrane protein
MRLPDFFDISTVKGVILSLAMGAVGFGAHQIVDASSDKHTLDEHTQQIEKLFEIAKQNQLSLQDAAVAAARIEGKLDVINQKIDDDRSTARSGH